MPIDACVQSEARTLIETRLASLADEYQVNILYACESGSRAWGFPSPDSDYDVRFVYMHPRHWYLSLEEDRDVIDLALEDSPAGLLDLGGWELRKTLRLLSKSNPVIWEWLFTKPTTRLGTFATCVVYSILFIRRSRPAIIICPFAAIR